MSRLLFILLPLLSSPPSAEPLVLRGQVVCSGCWTEADRAKVVYGTEADHECAARCAKDGLPAALAVYAANKFTIYRLAAAPALEGNKRLEWIGRSVEARGKLQQDAKGPVLHAETITEVPWESVGFPTGPPPARAAAAPAVKPEDLALADLDGFPQRLASLRGRVVVLNFWATWCLPCREEMPVLSQLQHRFAARGVQVIGASADPSDARAQVVRFAERLAINFPVWTGASTEAMTAFGLPPALPGTVVLDREGKIVERFPGVVTEKALTEAVERALAVGVGKDQARASIRPSRVPS